MFTIDGRYHHNDDWYQKVLHSNVFVVLGNQYIRMSFRQWVEKFSPTNLDGITSMMITVSVYRITLNSNLSLASPTLNSPNIVRVNLAETNHVVLLLALCQWSRTLLLLLLLCNLKCYRQTTDRALIPIYAYTKFQIQFCRLIKDRQGKQICT